MVTEYECVCPLLSRVTGEGSAASTAGKTDTPKASGKGRNEDIDESDLIASAALVAGSQAGSRDFPAGNAFGSVTLSTRPSARKLLDVLARRYVPVARLMQKRSHDL
jgi:hypothetical protein